MDSFDYKYSILQSIGIGCFSEVFKVRSIAHDNAHFAAKKIPMKLLNCEETSSTLAKEIDILKVVSHPNIVSLLDYATSSDHIYLIMELADGGELFDRIIQRGCYSEAHARDITQQILDACAYLHNINIVHRDLKPENVLFKTKDEASPIMITDFGLSALMNSQNMLKTACGTPGYAAPEVLLQVPYNEKVDSWSIGVIAYILLCGYPPFYNEEDNDAKLIQQIVDCDYEFHTPNWDNVSAAGKLFVSKLLHKDYELRLSCNDALRDPWVSDKGMLANGTEASSANDTQAALVIENLKESVASKQWRKAFDFVSVVERIKALSFT